MPRRSRFCPAGSAVHAIVRGNNRQIIFTSDKDMAAYAHWLCEGAVKYDVAIHGWVFMTNHVHLLATPSRNDALSKLFQFVGRLYVRYFNFSYARSGTLFEGRFRSSLVQGDEYFLCCLRYIELNPVRAGMVSDPGDYHWSSFCVHGHGLGSTMWSAHETYLALGQTPANRQYAYRALFNDVLDVDLIAKIRHCVNSGLVLGTEEFRTQVAALHG